MGRGGSGGEGIIFQEAEGGGLKRNEPHHVVERCCRLHTCLNIDRILQIQGVHRSHDFARVFKGLEKRAGYQ